MEWALDKIHHFGPEALFVLLMLGIVGLPIPDETLLVGCGFLIRHGELRPLPTWLFALAGSWCGISLSYTIGRTFGAGVIHRFGKRLHLTEERMAAVNRWFDRIGHWALFVGYYIAGLRHLTAITAGISKLRFRYFAAYAWSGGLLWVTTFLTLGYIVGDKWQQMAELIHHYLLYVSIGLGVLILVYYVWLRRKQRWQSIQKS